MALETIAAKAVAATGKLVWDKYSKSFMEYGENLINRKIDDLKRDIRDLENEKKINQVHPANKDEIESLEKGILQKKEEKVQLLKQLKDFQTTWAGFKWGQAEKRYKKRINDLYGFIRVLGSLEPVALDDIFTDVHILDKPSAYRRFNIEELSKAQTNPDTFRIETRTPGIRVIQRELGHRLYILGKPGAGKTTFMKYLVRYSIQGKLQKIPIFITLKDWADSGLEIKDFIVQQFNICDFPEAGAFIEYILESGEAILLFDGLDEVRKEANQRKTVIAKVHSFVQKYYRTQSVITCRVAATDYSFTEFTYIELADFDDKQVETYTRKWFHKSKDKADKFLQELNKPENRGVKELGRSPLLLSLICLAFDETLQIPQRRVELYEEALDALLKKWDASRTIERDEIYYKLSLGRKRQMFSILAAESFEKGEIFFQKRQLADRISEYLRKLHPADINDDPDGEFVLNAIAAQHGIFTEMAKDIFAFAHLTFQEYYAARYITSNTNEGTLERLAKYITDSRWREVFLLTASLLDEADHFFEIMKQTVDESILKNDTLRNMHNSILRRVSSIDGFHKSSLYSIYWYLILSLDVNRNRDLARTFARRGDYVRMSELASDLAYGLIFTLSKGYAERNDLALINALTIDRENRKLNEKGDLSAIGALESDIDLAKSLFQEKLVGATSPDSQINQIYLDWNMLYMIRFVRVFEAIGNYNVHVKTQRRIFEYFGEFVSYSKSIDHNLGVELEKIPYPNPVESKAEWNRFTRRLCDVSKKYRSIGNNWSVKNEELQRVIDNLYANQLLVDCLNVAIVSKRQAILDNLLHINQAD
jgi:hypothetical protein